MENYIGKVQIIPVINKKLTVTEQKDDKLIIELDDGRFFRSDIEHWDKGFTKLNHLSEPLDYLIGKRNVNKDGREMEIVEIFNRWKGGNHIKLKVLFLDVQQTVVTSLGAFNDKKVLSPPNVNSKYLVSVKDEIKKQYIGKEFINNKNENAIIIDYINASNVTVQFDDGSIKKCALKDLKKGIIQSDSLNKKEQTERSQSLLIDRTGERNMSTNSGEMEIVEYISTKEVIVKFLNDGSLKKVSYKHFKEGKVESDFTKEKNKQEIIERQLQIEKEKIEREQNRLRHIGESIELDCGKIATIIDWFAFYNVTVEIDGETFNVNYNSFLNGLPSINSKLEKKSMIGLTVKNNFDTIATIVDFKEKDNSFVLELDNGYSFERNCRDVCNNRFFTPYDLTVNEIGYVGEKYSCSDYPKFYSIWTGLLNRVYSKYDNDVVKTYKDCSICERWHCFSNFVDDMLEIWYDCDENLELDKDIKYVGNKMYSPDTCLLVPSRINKLFIGWECKSNHAVGVQFDKNKGKWRVKPLGVNFDDGKFRTGIHKYFENEKDAWEYYKNIKVEYVEKILGEYEGVIPVYVLNYCRKRVESMEF